ncbi:MAG: hypothetical protein GIW94_12305 [Candidatus Eremiobacteraeota bacterium]|nr:hypothetical protein [Candidatus Eremiobacteraeota bacterium]
MTSVEPQLQAPFVRSDAGTLRAALLVAPSPALANVRPLYGESNAIAERSAEQFAVFTNRLAADGVKATVIACEEATAFGALCADTAVLFSDGAFVMRPSDLRRRAEVAAVEAALERAGVPIIGRIEAPGLLDGGDVLVGPDAVYLGIPHLRRDENGIPVVPHGNLLGREQLAAYASAKGLRTVFVSQNADVFRLRAVAAFVSDDTVLCAPGVLDAVAFQGLRLLEVPRGEDYGAGVLTLGSGRVLANVRFRQTLPLLRKAKVAVDAIDLWEFGKIGATPSLLALAVHRA